MKKTALFVLTAALLLSLCACGGSSDAPASEAEDSGTTQTADAPAQEEQTEAPSEEPISETASDEEAPADADSGTEGSLWETYYYVDNFNQPTEDGYIGNSTCFLGTFSNSATTDSELLVNVVVDEVDVAFFLYEYGRNRVKNSSSSRDDLYNITMRTADGADYSFTGVMYCGGDRIYVEQAHIAEVISALSQEGNAMTSFYVEDADRTTTHYLFTVISNNFAAQYETLMQ